MELSGRQQKLLKELMEKFIEQAEPVSSAMLAELLKVSSATIRNEMAELENLGYIRQPHTSAGRIPTMKGYQHYLSNHVQVKMPAKPLQDRLGQCLKAETPVKDLAKEISESTKLAVMVAMERNNFYYTGLSRLFAQPEFIDQNFVVSISSVLDAFDEGLSVLYKTAKDETTVLLGPQNPFSPYCSLVLARVSLSDKDQGILAVLGPLRMDYNRTVSLLDFTQSLLSKHY